MGYWSPFGLSLLITDKSENRAFFKNFLREISGLLIQGAVFSYADLIMHFLLGVVSKGIFMKKPYFLASFSFLALSLCGVSAVGGHLSTADSIKGSSCCSFVGSGGEVVGLDTQHTQQGPETIDNCLRGVAHVMTRFLCHAVSCEDRSLGIVNFSKKLLVRTEGVPGGQAWGVDWLSIVGDAIIFLKISDESWESLERASIKNSFKADYILRLASNLAKLLTFCFLLNEMIERPKRFGLCADIFFNPLHGKGGLRKIVFAKKCWERVVAEGVSETLLQDSSFYLKTVWDSFLRNDSSFVLAHSIFQWYQTPDSQFAKNAYFSSNGFSFCDFGLSD